MEILGLVAIMIIILSIVLFIQYYTTGSCNLGNTQGFTRRPDNSYNAFFKEFDKIFNRGIKSEKIKTVQECLDSLEHLYSETDVRLGTNGSRVCTTDIEDIRSHLEGLEKDSWLDKVDKHLQEFIDCYEEIMSGDLDNFNDVELLFKIKKKCINEWQKYFAVDLSPYRTRMYPKKYFRETLEELGIYDPCMESHDTLEKKLSEKVQSMRPEYKRKMKLYGIIVNYVCQKNSVPRSEFDTIPKCTSFDTEKPKLVQNISFIPH